MRDDLRIASVLPRDRKVQAFLNGRAHVEARLVIFVGLGVRSCKSGDSVERPNESHHGIEDDRRSITRCRLCFFQTYHEEGFFLDDRSSIPY
jgi:hypothetical protein